MNTTDLARHRELFAKAELTDGEFVELEMLDIAREQDEERHLAAITETYSAIQRDEAHAVHKECSALNLITTSI